MKAGISEIAYLIAINEPPQKQARRENKRLLIMEQILSFNESDRIMYIVFIDKFDHAITK